MKKEEEDGTFIFFSHVKKEKLRNERGRGFV